MKMRWKLTYLPMLFVDVSLEADHGDDHGKLAFQGDAYPVSVVRDYLLQSHGLDGHILAEETTPADLNAAMRSEWMKRFAPELVSGAELLKTTKRRGLP